MSKIMKTTSLTALLARAAGEFEAKASIYGIPESLFREMFALEADSPGMNVMSGRASLPVGPAAGPHTQIAPNILAAYLSGARVFELKTVQQNDRLDIDKPCIDALDEGHNVEWSTELTLEEARKEYINSWITVNLFSFLLSRKPNDFFFNMSVGYTLDGIMSGKMNSFIEGMRRPETTTYWSQAMDELEHFIAGAEFSRAFGDAAAEKARTLAAYMPVRPVHSVTLSTMHGCPPAEIGRIGHYLIEEKGFDTYIKLNPTLLGFDEARRILDHLGWDDIAIKKESFEHDLQFTDALALIKDLGDAAQAKGRRFGIKLSNTLANANNGTNLPGAERYMSGRALFPITLHLAAKVAKALPEPGIRISYCGGVSALNAADLIKAGLGPLTVATDILKPGGYLRLAQIAREVVNALPLPLESGPTDAATLESLANAVLDRPEYRKGWKAGMVSIARKLPLHDCFAAPCVEACPVNQKVPAYIKEQGAGLSDQALATILSDNPLPHITGVLCDHVCQERCSRIDYEGSVRIRDVKLAAARAANIPAMPLPPELGVTGGRTAVIGAGPAGLACAFHLAAARHEVQVFDAGPAPGGVPANVIPPFRISREEIAQDIDRIASMGVGFSFGTTIASIGELRKEGFTSFFICTGADSARELSLKGSGVETMDALDFLKRFGTQGLKSLSGIRRVIVAGGGNTACDAVRAATRIPGIESVQLSYRRTRREMPADLEELENAITEAMSLKAKMGGSPIADDILLELTLPEEARTNSLVLRKMALGEKDASGRRSPLPTEESFALPCDLLVKAIGEEPNRKLLEGFGIGMDRNRLPVADPSTMETNVADVYLGGDARRGPASIIAAEADGRAAARTILVKEGFILPTADYNTPRMDVSRLAKRGELLHSLSPEDPGFAAREADRCLACDSACLRCVEVCPNRANMYIETRKPFDQDAQILHLDRLCNECGNCGFFCPYDGEPFTGKATLFDNQQDLEGSRNAGFAFVFERGLPWLALRAEVGGPAFRLDYASWNGVASAPAIAPMIALAREVYRTHHYLLEEAR
jgi:putative selenate reductase